jgi:hypothetical protein
METKRAFYYGCVLQISTPRWIGWSVGHDSISTGRICLA